MITLIEILLLAGQWLAIVALVLLAILAVAAGIAAVKAS